MADIQNLQLGHANITLGGVDLGLTRGGVEIAVTNNILDRVVDQYGESPVGAVNLGTRVEITVNVAEITAENISKLMNGATLEAGATIDEVNIGAEYTGADVNTAEMVITPVADSGDGSKVWTFYKVALISPPTVSLVNDTETTLQATFLVITDTSKPTGEEMGRLGTADA